MIKNAGKRFLLVLLAFLLLLFSACKPREEPPDAKYQDYPKDRLLTIVTGERGVNLRNWSQERLNTDHPEDASMPILFARSYDSPGKQLIVRDDGMIRCRPEAGSDEITDFLLIGSGLTLQVRKLDGAEELVISQFGELTIAAETGKPVLFSIDFSTEALFEANGSCMVLHIEGRSNSGEIHFDRVDTNKVQVSGLNGSYQVRIGPYDKVFADEAVGTAVLLIDQSDNGFITWEINDGIAENIRYEPFWKEIY